MATKTKKGKFGEPKLNSEGKKDWVGFFNAMDDKTILSWVTESLKKMPMAYLKAAGQRLAKIK